LLQEECLESLERIRATLPKQVPPPEPLGDIGHRIRSLRKDRKLSIDQLAKLCGVHRQAVYQWETGATKNIRNATLIKLLKALDTDFEYLVHGASSDLRKP
jgi:transcriptional regulator with XRE-family HTH domain